jgi:hypothetical protein
MINEETTENSAHMFFFSLIQNTENNVMHSTLKPAPNLLECRTADG